MPLSSGKISANPLIENPYLENVSFHSLSVRHLIPSPVGHFISPVHQPATATWPPVSSGLPYLQHFGPVGNFEGLEPFPLNNSNIIAPPMLHMQPGTCRQSSFQGLANDYGSSSNSQIELANNIVSPSSSSCPSIPVPQLSRESFHVGYYVPPSVEPGDPYGGLEIVWKQHFDLLFRGFSHYWSFGPTDERLQGWTEFRDMAKVRFACQKCLHGWTTMYGLVVFYYRFIPTTNQGEARFLLMGQKCMQCQTGHFETPMWYPEEAQKVLTNLFYEIASKVYGMKTPSQITDRRHGRPRQQHVASSCQGCHLGICKPHPTNSLQQKPHQISADLLHS